MPPKEWHYGDPLRLKKERREKLKEAREKRKLINLTKPCVVNSSIKKNNFVPKAMKQNIKTKKLQGDIMAQRFIDILFSIVGILLLFPLFLIVAILIKIDSQGTVFFTQNRVGLNNSRFKIIKFRTMKVNKQKNHIKLTIGTKDPRITTVGYILRKYKIDELPQLFNVLMGQMSLVGPRPEVPEYIKYYSQQEKKILSIRPGITDWASIKYFNENYILQKSNKPEKTYISKIMKEKLYLNKYYLNNYNLKTYFKIIFITIFSLIKAKSYSVDDESKK